jgi:hypothetical protein
MNTIYLLGITNAVSIHILAISLYHIQVQLKPHNVIESARY